MLALLSVLDNEAPIPLRRPSRNIDSNNGYLTGGDLGGVPSPNVRKFEYAGCADVWVGYFR